MILQQGLSTLLLVGGLDDAQHAQHMCLRCAHGRHIAQPQQEMRICMIEVRKV